MRDVVIIAHDIRSTFNVGSLLRTVEGMGVKKVYFTGYTPHPLKDPEDRLPHIAKKLHEQIKKTSLGAEKLTNWAYREDPRSVIADLQANGYVVAALEQSAASKALHHYKAPKKIALLLGTEVTGLPKELLQIVPTHLEISMHGSKESFNVVIAAAMAMYQFRYF